MVGRAAERAQLDSLLAGLTTGHCPGLIHIVGDAGLGKSRLAGYLQSRSITAAIRCLRMNADSLRRTTGFYPWRQLVGALVGPDYSTVDLTDLLADDPAMAALVPLLSPVLQTAISESEFTAQLFGAGRAEKTQGVITALLEHLIGPAPQVVIVEDAHWFDSASWQLLERFSRAFGHATLVPVCRPLDPDALPFEARRLLDMPGAQVIRLGPFSRAESVDPVNASLNVVETAPAIVELIYSHAEGQPLFTGGFGVVFARSGVGADRRGLCAFADGRKGQVANRLS